MEPKKQRGRPKGTVIPTDRRVLSSMADLLLKEPALRPTAAIKRILPDWTDSVVHRLTGKWRKQKEALLADARQRQDAREVRGTTTGGIRAGGSMANLMDQMRAIHDNPAVRAAREMANSPAMKAMQEMQNSPVMRAIREIQDNPTMRAIKAMQDNPIMKMMREQEHLRRDLGF
jgi:hypothetical protein